VSSISSKQGNQIPLSCRIQPETELKEATGERHCLISVSHVGFIRFRERRSLNPIFLSIFGTSARFSLPGSASQFSLPVQPPGSASQFSLPVQPPSSASQFSLPVQPPGSAMHTFASDSTAEILKMNLVFFYMASIIVAVVITLAMGSRACQTMW
jgi:hypothetical protein